MNLYDLKTILKYSDVNLLAMSYSVPTDHISVNNVPICIEKLGCHLLLFYMLVIEHDTAFVQGHSGFPCDQVQTHSSRKLLPKASYAIE